MQSFTIDEVADQVVAKGWQQVVIISEEDEATALRLVRSLQSKGVRFHLVEPGVPFDDLPWDGLIYGKDGQEAQRKHLADDEYILADHPLPEQIEPLPQHVIPR